MSTEDFWDKYGAVECKQIIGAHAESMKEKQTLLAWHAVRIMNAWGVKVQVSDLMEPREVDPLEALIEGGP